MAKMDKQQAIVSVRDFFEENNTAYIVMEYIDGTTFCDLVKQRGRIPPGELFPPAGAAFWGFGPDARTRLNPPGHFPGQPDAGARVVRLLDFGCARESTRGTETLTIALKQATPLWSSTSKKAKALDRHLRPVRHHLLLPDGEGPAPGSG